MISILHILLFVALACFACLGVFIYWDRKARAIKKQHVEFENKLRDLKKMHDKGLEIQKAAFDNKISEIENNLKSEVLGKIISGKEPNNPFGSYMLPVLKISSLYEVKDVLEKLYKSGMITEESYKIKSEWLNKEIIRKTGSDYYDDTKLDIDEA